MAGRVNQYAGIEFGGTKVVCAVGSGPEDLRVVERLPTGDPASTRAAVVAWFRRASDAEGPVRAVGLSAFGPIQTHRDRPGFGRMLATPKPGWSGSDLVGPLRDALGVPVGLETDVVGAALAEGRWGAARGVASFAYLTVGTGIGGGAVAGGRPIPGMPHAEMGHQSVERQPDDDFPGVCPYHGACLEGLAAGPAIHFRWGAPGESLRGDRLVAAVDLEARYLADGLRTIVYVLAPERIVVGGGVARLPGLLPRLRERLRASLAGYPGIPEHDDDGFVRPVALGGLAGVLGGFIIAEEATRTTAGNPGPTAGAGS
jgi:fructokinase